MCGLVCVFRKDGKNAIKTTLKRFDKQRERGKEGFGAALINGETLTHLLRDTDEEGIREKMEKEHAQGVLFHHRFPTSTINIEEATHPIVVKHPSLKYMYLVTHNGVITNCDELRQEQEALGHEYTTKIVRKWETSVHTYTDEEYNDSEAFAIELAYAIEQGKEITSKGAIAFIAFQLEYGTNKLVKVFFGRNSGNPLTMENTPELFALSSQNGTTKLDAHTLYSFDGKKIESTPFEIGKYATVEMGYSTKYYSESAITDYRTGRGYVESDIKYARSFDQVEDNYWELYQKKEELRLELIEMRAADADPEDIREIESEMLTLDIEMDVLDDLSYD